MITSINKLPNDWNTKLRQREEAARRVQSMLLLKQSLENVQNFAAYARCVAAGKCGARVQYVASSGQPTCGVSSSNGANGTSSDPIPASGEPAEEKGLVLDCVKTTLRLNYLQNLVERQPGYFDER